MPMKPFNIILIIADALRRDSVSIFNDQLSRSSPLYSRMSSWYHFQHCFSSAPWTLPSCATIFSGIHSTTHNSFSQSRPLGRPTLTHYLGDAYYKAGIINNGNLKPFSGLHEGFHEYHYFASHDQPYEKATEFLRDRKSSEPYFLFFHTNIPHDYFKEVSQRYYQSAFPERKDWFFMDRAVINWAALSPDRRGKVRSFYDACVSRMDEQLSSLLDLVDLDRTILCFVADHGEGFDPDRGRVHHGGRMHDDLIAVPLAIHLPQSAPAKHHEALAANQQTMVSTSDICPTLSELAGRPVPPGLEGDSILRPPAQLSTRCLPVQDRRYLYGPNCERFNINRSGQNTSWWSRLKNRIGQHTVAKDFDLKAYIEFPYKLIVTSYVRSRLVPRSSLTSMFRRRLFYPKSVLCQHQNLTVSVELFHLDSDPEEIDNLLSKQPAKFLRDSVRDTMKGYKHMKFVVDGTHYDLDFVLQHPLASDSAHS